MGRQLNDAGRTGDRRRLLWLPVLLAGLLLLAACAPPPRSLGLPCGERRLQLAGVLYQQARDHLAEHFTRRTDASLGDAFYASRDSVILARATRNCFDFDEVVRRQAVDLIKANLLFQKLVVSNMRDQDPGVVVDLYGRGYREMEIFKNDIR